MQDSINSQQKIQHLLQTYP